MLTIPHYLDNQLSDVGEVVSIKHRMEYNAQIYLFFLWYSFLLDAEQTQKVSAAGWIW
jgi:hypothetical protein